MATLIVTAYTPRADSGRGLRTIGVARALARTDEVEIRYVAFGGQRPAPVLEGDARICLRCLRASRGVRRALCYLRARRAGTPRAFARAVSPELVPAAEVAERFDRVVADGPAAAAALLLVGAVRGSVAYCAHNLESRFRLRLAGASRDYGTAEGLAAFERTIIERSSEAWFPTVREVEAAQLLAPGGRVRHVPNVVDVREIEPVRPEPGSRRIVFVGDFTYEPNRNGLRFLLREVMPLVWRRVPDARLAVVGRGVDPTMDADPRVDVLGFVESLEEVYASAACAIVPLLEGGGSPFKLIEAMAYGLPVVATPVAARGLEAAVADVHYLEAGDPVELARAACSAVLDPGTVEIGRNARRLVEAEYSIEALAARLGG